MADEKSPELSDVVSAAPVADSELGEAYSGPALHANRIFATAFEGGMRLTFLEQLGPIVPVQFRAAVFLSYGDVFQLRDLLNRQLEGVKAIEVGVDPDGNPTIKNG